METIINQGRYVMKRGENEAKEEREKIRNKEKKMSVTKREKGGWEE